jgi:hypothetical protein
MKGRVQSDHTMQMVHRWTKVVKWKVFAIRQAVTLQQLPWRANSS